MAIQLDDCPMCGTKLVYPDAPTIDLRGLPGGRRRVIVDIPCTGCPAKVTVFEDSGAICCFTPNVPLTVRNVR